MKNCLILLFGIIIGTCISWPGIIFLDNWKCFIKIIKKSNNNELSLKAIMATSPRNFFKSESNQNISKLRIVGDACFR
tara:strand:- start:83 stop:316 length:234 start_codon:yes stop_codon:yes gene_type:complete